MPISTFDSIQVSVDQECLESFLKTAQLLRVKGLTDDTNPSNASNSNISGTGPNGNGSNNNNFSPASQPSRNGDARLNFK